MSNTGTGWSSFAKAALVVAAIAVGLLIVVIVIGAIWWNRHGRELMNESRAAINQGQYEGIRNDEDGCLQHSLEDAKGDHGIDMSLILKRNLRLQACLSTAKISPNFCMSVPRVVDIVASARWKVQKCSNSTGCQSVLSVQQTYCESSQRRGKLEAKPAR